MRTTTALRPDTVAGYVAAFEDLEGGRGGEPSWLRAARRQAIAAFEQRGFPTTRDEDWRFTNVSPIASRLFPVAGARESPAVVAIADRAVVPGLEGPVLVFLDGRYAPALSYPGRVQPGLEIGSLATAMSLGEAGWIEEHLARHAQVAGRPFVALNSALFVDGAFIRAGRGLAAEQAVQVVFVSTGAGRAQATHPRVLVVAEPHSQLRVVETFVGPSQSEHLTDAVTEIVAGEAAVVEHYRLQREGARAFHVGQTQLRLGRSSTVTSHAVALGGAIARHDVVAELAGEGADCTLNGLYLGAGTQLVDNHTEIDHASPHCASHEVYKGILAGRARGVFNGRIRVRPDAQKTDARQTNKTLLLSDEAQVNTKPQLEIFANDVKCTHGATVGQLSEDALFYLRARGIGAADARNLLTRAFVVDVVDRMRLTPVRGELERLLAGRLAAAMGEGAAA